MDNTQVKQYIDNVNINIETPSDDSDIGLQALERDNWGRILNNKTFKIIKENFRLIKTSFNNFISNVTNEINTLVNKTNTIENNVNTVQSTVNELKVNVGKINESTLNLLANKETTNIFKELNTFEKGINTKSINLENNTLSVMEGETITIGDINKSINIVGKDTTLKYNGEEIKGGNNSNDGSITLPNNLVYNNQANDFTILPTYNSLNFATEKYVNDEMQDYIKHEEKMNWMGTDGYGGLLQDVGTKKVGIAYYDKANKQMVVPTVENSLTYFEGSKFIPISDYQNAKKLENLYKVSETVEVPNSVFSMVRFWRYGNRAFLYVYFDYGNSNEVNWMTEGIPLTNYPANFIPDTPFLNTEHVILSNNNLDKSITRLVLRNDRITIHGVEGMFHYEIKGIISYMTK